MTDRQKRREREIVLEKVKVALQQALIERDIAHLVHPNAYIEMFADEMAYKMTCERVAMALARERLVIEEVDEQTESVDVPASAFAALLCCIGLGRFAAMKTISVTASAAVYVDEPRYATVCPHIANDAKSMHLRYLVGDPTDV
jgi:hypothetical protein